jgi:predicted acylesterase/phospholipase RssA
MTSTKRVNLALQGGGSHGAFTWGVLDALIEDGRLAFEAVSGTSADAMNAAIMLQGWSQGGGPGARAALGAFWTELGTMAIASPIQRTPLDRLQGNWNLDDSPAALWADLIQRTLTPWQRNPLKFDPLRELLRRHFDEKAVRACREIKASIAATNGQTGKVRIFTREELSIDALLASACLPNVHDAVIVDGVPYWDGGFRGNPPIWPFIYKRTPWLRSGMVRPSLQHSRRPSSRTPIARFWPCRPTKTAPTCRRALISPMARPASSSRNWRRSTDARAMASATASRRCWRIVPSMSFTSSPSTASASAACRSTRTTAPQRSPISSTTASPTSS